MFYKFSQWLDRGINQEAPSSKICDHPQCKGLGIHRAPKSRENLQRGVNDWYWFCLDHIRDYNAKWNYYEGMSEKNQLQDRIDDTVWQRPSWSFTQQDHPEDIFIHVRDPFGLFDSETTSVKTSPKLTKDQKNALHLLALSYPFTKEQLQDNYRSLAKKYHPDANSSSSTEDFRKIHTAYTILKNI